MNTLNSEAGPLSVVTKVLHVDASMRRSGSRSRLIGASLLQRLHETRGPLQVVHRDLADGEIPFVDEAWIGANFTPPSDRSSEHRAVLGRSDVLLNELKAADVLVIATPIYNFGVPAALKAWVDMVARAQEAFRYSSNGPEGLLVGKKGYLVVVSGGTEMDSPVDFATPYLRHVLGFLGISEVETVGSDLRGIDADQANRTALDVISGLGRNAPRKGGVEAAPASSVRL